MKKIPAGNRFTIDRVSPRDLKSFKSLCVTRDTSMSDVIRSLFRKVAEGDVALLDRICK